MSRMSLRYDGQHDGIQGDKGFLTKQEKESGCSASSELPKAFIITSDGLKERVYLSQISSRTLALRAKKAVGE